MGKGGGGGSQTQTQTTTLPSYIQGPLKRLLARAEGVADTEYLSYDPSARVAGLSQDELSAFDLIRQNAGAYSPFVDEALGGTQSVLSQLGQAPSSSTMQSYMNPYLQQVLDRQRYEAERSYDISSKKLGDQAQAASAFGGSRFAVANNELQDDYLDNLANIQAEGMNNAWTQAQNQYNLDIQNRLSGNMQLANLAGLGQQQVSNTAGLLQGAGQQQRAIDQALLDADYQEFQNYNNYDRNNLSWLSGIIQPSVNAMQGNTTTTKTEEAGGSMFGKILGTGLSIAAMGIPGGGTIGGSLFGSALGSAAAGGQMFGPPSPFANGGRIPSFADGGAIPAMQPVNRSSLPQGSWWDRIASRVSSTPSRNPTPAPRTGVGLNPNYDYATRGFGGLSGMDPRAEAKYLSAYMSDDPNTLKNYTKRIGIGLNQGKINDKRNREVGDQLTRMSALAEMFGINRGYADGGPIPHKASGSAFDNIMLAINSKDPSGLGLTELGGGDLSSNTFMKILGMLDAVDTSELAPIPGRKPNMTPGRDRYATPFPVMPTEDPNYQMKADAMREYLPSFMEYDDSDIPSELPMDRDEAKFASGGSIEVGENPEDITRYLIAMGALPPEYSGTVVKGQGRNTPPPAPGNVLSVGPLTLTDKARKEGGNPWLSINASDVKAIPSKLQSLLEKDPYVPDVSDSRLERLVRGTGSDFVEGAKSLARIPFKAADAVGDVGDWLKESPDLSKGTSAKEAFKADMEELNAARKNFVDTAPKPELAKLTTPKGKTSQGVPVEVKKPTKAEQAQAQPQQQKQKSVVEEMFGSTNVPMLMAGIALMTSKGDPFSALGEGLGAYIQGKESVGQMKQEAKKAEREAMLEGMKMSFEQQKLALMERELGLKASELGRGKPIDPLEVEKLRQGYFKQLVDTDPRLIQGGLKPDQVAAIMKEHERGAINMVANAGFGSQFLPAIMREAEEKAAFDARMSK